MQNSSESAAMEAGLIPRLECEHGQPRADQHQPRPREVGNLSAHVLTPRLWWPEEEELAANNNNDNREINIGSEVSNLFTYSPGQASD